MRIAAPLLSALALAAATGCRPDGSATQNAAPVAAAAAENPFGDLQGAWQLDYYPDSLLLNRDIYEYSNWSAPYAANLRFVADSCEMSGWHESGWAKVVPNFRQKGTYWTPGEAQYSEFQLVGDDALWFREVNTADTSRFEYGDWYPYHRVAQPLTRAGLKRRVAAELFAGRYRVLQTDRPADSVVVLGADFAVRGLPRVARYDVVTAMDWDFLLPNGFSWRDGKGEPVAQYSFQFSGDTLLLRNFELRPEDDSVPSGVLVAGAAAKLLKLPLAGAEGPLAGPKRPLP